MKCFLEMCDVVRSSGITNGAPTDTPTFWSYVEQCQPFVFSLVGEVTESPELKDEAGNAIRREFDAPFPVFSIEILDGNIMVPDRRENWDFPTTVHCILVAEHAPRQYVYYLYMSTELRGKQLKCVVKADFMDALVEKFIDRINAQKCGTEHVRERIKVGVGKSKHTHTIRRIVHVRPKSQRTEANEASGRQIEWTHRWWRRGHWREISGLGKDRSGNYCVAGKTWVMEHTAGAPDGVVVAKTRVVDE